MSDIVIDYHCFCPSDLVTAKSPRGHEFCAHFLQDCTHFPLTDTWVVPHKQTNDLISEARSQWLDVSDTGITTLTGVSGRRIV